MDRGLQQMQMLRFVRWLALPVGLLVGGISMASAQEVSQEVQQACTPDAMRLCSEFIPDRAKITACMIHKKRELSETCLAAMHSGIKGRRVIRRAHYEHEHEHHHHYRHHHHR
jgi:hypothetical protein